MERTRIRELELEKGEQEIKRKKKPDPQIVHVFSLQIDRKFLQNPRCIEGVLFSILAAVLAAGLTGCNK